MYTDNLLSYQIFSESLYENFALYYNPETGNIQTWSIDNRGNPLEPYDSNNPKHLEAAREEARGLFLDMDSPISRENRGVAEDLWGALTPEEQNEHLSRVSKIESFIGNRPGSDAFYKDKLTMGSDGKLSIADMYGVTPSPAGGGTTIPTSTDDMPAPVASNPAQPTKGETIEQQIDRMGVKDWIESQGGMDSFVNNAYSGTYRHGNERRNVWGDYYDELQNIINNSKRGQEEINSWKQQPTPPPVQQPVTSSTTLQGTPPEQLTKPEDVAAAAQVEAASNSGTGGYQYNPSDYVRGENGKIIYANPDDMTDITYKNKANWIPLTYKHIDEYGEDYKKHYLDGNDFGPSIVDGGVKLNAPIFEHIVKTNDGFGQQFVNKYQNDQRMTNQSAEKLGLSGYTPAATNNQQSQGGNTASTTGTTASASAQTQQNQQASTTGKKP